MRHFSVRVHLLTVIKLSTSKIKSTAAMIFPHHTGGSTDRPISSKSFLSELIFFPSSSLKIHRKIVIFNHHLDKFRGLKGLTYT